MKSFVPRLRLTALLVVFAPVAYAPVAAAQTMPPAIGKPLLAAEEDLNAHRYADALAQLNRAAAQPNKTAAEILAIDQLRAGIDAGRGAHAAAAQDYATLMATGQLSPGQMTQMAEGEASSQYQAGNYTATIATINRYLRNVPQFHQILLQSYYQLHQCKELNSIVLMQHPPAKAGLELVENCYANAKDTAGVSQTIIELVQYYPTPANWANLIGQLQAEPVFNQRLALGFFRLKQAVGLSATHHDYIRFAEDSVARGLPNEALKIMQAGTKAGVLGVGDKAASDTHLQQFIAKRQAAWQAGLAASIAQAKANKDSASLFSIGFNQVYGGDKAGLGLMEDAIRSGGLAHNGQAELDMGIAFALSGQQANALAMWHSVKGSKGAEQLAKLWILVK